MASAADALARFMPSGRLQGPDDSTRDQIIERIAEEQQRRIGQMGDVQAQGAAIPGQAVQNAVGAFKEGTKFKQSEEQHGRAMTAQDTANRYNADIAGGYEKDQAALDEEDPNSEEGLSFREQGKQNPIREGSLSNRDLDLSVSGKERRAKFMTTPNAALANQTPEQAGMQQETQEAAKAPAIAEENRARVARESQQNIAASKASVDSTYHIIKDSDQDREGSMIKTEMEDAAAKNPQQGPQRDQAIAAIGRKWSSQTRTGLPSGYILALGDSVGRGLDTAKAQAAAGLEAGKQTLPSTGELGKASGNALGGVKAVNAMKALAKQYKGAAYQGSPEGATALRGFVATMQSLGDANDGFGQELMAKLSSHNPLDGTNTSLMDQAISHYSDKVAHDWETSKAGLPGASQERSNYATTDSAVRALAGGVDHNSADLTGNGAGGRHDSRGFTAGTKGKSGNAAAAPAGQPPPPASQPPPMMTPGMAPPPPVGVPPPMAPQAAAPAPQGQAAPQMAPPGPPSLPPAFRLPLDE